MVNIYLWYTSSSSVPSGWTEIDSAYRDRLVCVSGTPLSTGGSLTHNHGISAVSANRSASKAVTSTTGFNNICNATHSHSCSTNITQADSLPISKAYRLIYKDYSNFNGLLPANVGVTRTATPGDGWTEVDNGESYFFYIGDSSDVGASYGSSSHYHPVSVSLNSATFTTNDSGIGGTSFAHKTHGHSSAGANSSTNSGADFKRVGETKFWKTTTTVYSLPANCYAYFDGTLPSGWTEITAATDHLHYKGTGTSFTATAGTHALVYSHNHTSGFNSGSQTATATTGTGSEGGNYPHNHYITITINSADQAPPYVRFKMAYNTSEINAISTETKTYSMDTLLKKTRTSTYQMDVILKAIRSKAIETDILLKKSISKNYDIDMLLNKTLTASITANVQLQKTIGANYDLSAVIQKNMNRFYSMGLQVIVPYRELTMDMSMLLQRTLTTDALFNVLIQGMNNKDYEMGVLVEKTLSESYDINTLLLKNIRFNYSLDLLLRARKINSYEIDTLLIQQKNLEYAIDTKIAARLNKNYLSTLYIKNTISKDFEMSFLIASKIDKPYFMGYSVAKPHIITSKFNLAIIRPRSYDYKRKLPIIQEIGIYPSGNDYYSTYDIPVAKTKAFPADREEKIISEGSDYDNAVLPIMKKRTRVFRTTI